MDPHSFRMSPYHTGNFGHFTNVTSLGWVFPTPQSNPRLWHVILNSTSLYVAYLRNVFLLETDDIIVSVA